jgi:hypothetical protein
MVYYAKRIKAQAIQWEDLLVEFVFLAGAACRRRIEHCSEEPVSFSQVPEELYNTLASSVIALLKSSIGKRFESRVESGSRIILDNLSLVHSVAA